MFGISVSVWVIVGGMILAILLLFSFIAQMFRKAGPNEAFVVYGFRGTRVIKGGGTVIFPMFESFRSLSLELMSFDVAPQQNLYTKQGVAVTVEAVAQIKVRSDRESIETAAEQFLTKPLELPALQVILQRLLEKQRNANKQLASKSRQVRQAVDPFIGNSAAITALAAQARRVLSTESPVLILGETGSGKGVLARWLHENSPRAEEAFVDLNCAGLSRELLETELFGHEKGAFTSATASKQGLFEVAHRGSIFLDEVGDVDLQIQPKLLKVLEEKRFRRVGDVRDRQVDVRLIAATHQDIGQLVREKRFRDDLYFRISTIPLAFPALRDRIEDIPEMGRYLLSKLSGDLGRGEIEQKLVEYAVRETCKQLGDR